MKKIMLIMSAAVLALATSCQKPAPADTLTLVSVSSTAPIVKEGTEDPIVITFAATKAWKATVNNTEFATVTPKSGEAGELNKVKLNVAENASVADREIVVTLASEGVEPVQVKFTQNSQYHMIISQEEFSAPVKGGEFTFTVDANVKYAMKDYADTFTWMHVVPGNGNDYKVTIDANATYDERTSYIKFTTSEIQVPVLNEEGNETGETEDLAIRVYFYQEGNAVKVWEVAMTDAMAVAGDEYGSFTAAVADGKMYVSNGQGIWSVDAATGKIGNKLDLKVNPLGIANDDAGHVVAFVGGEYPLGEGDPYNDFEAFIVNTSDFSLTPLFNAGKNAFYGYGLDGITITGDVTKKAAITMFSGAGWEGGSYLVFYQIENGKLTSEGHTDYVGLAWTAAMWSSRHAFGVCTTDDIFSGVMYNGYDGKYNLYYNPGTSGANWQEVFVTGSSWAEGYNAGDVIEWNGHKYICFLAMAYFPNWGMPSSLYVMNIDNPAAPELLTKQDFYAQTEAALDDSTALVMAVEDGALCAYIADSEQGSILKIKLPVL